MLIGIAGASCSGKSTVAKEVAASLDAALVHLDGRWIKGSETPLVNGHPSYEQPHQYDGESLLRDTLEAMGRHANVVVEGFLLFLYPGILEACDHRFFLDVPHEELVRRRQARSTGGGNTTGWGQLANDGVVDVGWMAHGQQEWERFGAGQAHLDGVVTLDGHRPAIESAGDILRHVGVVSAPAHP